MKTAEEYIDKAERVARGHSVDREEAAIYAQLASAVATLRQAKALEELVEYLQITDRRPND
jgi:hypothetical protein